MNVQRWMSQQFFVFFMTWGIFLPYWTGWMVDTKGISVAQVSFIMSLGLIVRGVANLVVFPYFAARFSNKVLLNAMGVATFLSILLYVPAQSYGSLLLVTLLVHFFYPTLMPALDSTAGVLVQAGEMQHYGKARSWGSIGFVVTGIVLTLFTGILGDAVILWAMLLGSFALMLLGLLKSPASLMVKPEVRHVASSDDGIKALFQVKGFSFILLIVILLQAGHAAYYNYGYLFLQEIEAPKIFIGLILNIAVLAEIVFFAKADVKFYRMSVGSLLALASLGATVRWVLVFIFPNVYMFAFAQVLHAASFAMGHYAFMKYLTREMPAKQIPHAQGVYSAFALSWATALFTLFGGYLYDEVSPRSAFLGMIVCTIPAFLLAFFYRKSQARVVEGVDERG